MENATKALLMAAGILITIIVLSLAIVMYSRISEYYQQKNRNISEEQLAAFNSEYTAYDRTDVTGFELVSLINKTIDFNQNKVYGANNTGEKTEEQKLGDGYTEMSITVQLNSSKDWVLFKNKNPITYDGKNNSLDRRQLLSSAILEMQELEKNINSNDLRKLTSHTSEFNSINSLNEMTEFIKEITGNEYTTAFNNLKIESINNSLDKLKNKIVKYEEYLEFKRAEYNCLSDKTVYKNGQIVSMYFVQK